MYCTQLSVAGSNNYSESRVAKMRSRTAAAQLREVASAQFAKKSEKTVVILWILSTKTYFSQRNQVATTLLQLAKDASNVPSFKFILHVHQQASCCSETFFWKFFERIKTFAMISGCFYWANSEYWEVKSISRWGCIVFRHCEGKDSWETIRCICQAKLNHP